MSGTTAENYERWAIEKRARQRVAREIAQALEDMTPLWMANDATVSDGIDQRAAVRLARAIGGVDADPS